jgi:hypothetical protein
MIWTRHQEPEPNRKLERKVQNWANRMAQAVDENPDVALKESQQILKWSLRKTGPNSSFTIKAMNEVANQFARQHRVPEEIGIRETIVEALRRNVGTDDEATLGAELKLATCLIALARTEEADPLLVHVVAERSVIFGEEDPRTLAAMAWRATVMKKLGRLAEARALQDRIVNGYEAGDQRESTQALTAVLNLVSTLSELDELDAARRLLRGVLDVRTRTLGSDDPKTLEVLHLLTSFQPESDEDH